MTSATLVLPALAATLWAISIVLAIALLRLFERQATWMRAARIVVWAFGISTAALLAYWAISILFKFSDSADSVVSIAWPVLTAMLITRRARADGIPKISMIGIGGKVMLCVTLLIWLAGIFVLMAVYPSA